MNRFGEEAHLFGVDAVVDVVLAVDGVAGGFEDVAEGGAEGGTAAGADGDGAVGVDGDEFDVDFLRVVVVGFVEVVGVVEGLGEELGGPGGVEVEVDEAGAGDFGGGDGSKQVLVNPALTVLILGEGKLCAQDGGEEDFGEGSGVCFGSFGGNEAEIGGEIAVVGLLGGFDFDGD